MTTLREPSASTSAAPKMASEISNRNSTFIGFNPCQLLPSWSTSLVIFALLDIASCWATLVQAVSERPAPYDEVDTTARTRARYDLGQIHANDLHYDQGKVEEDVPHVADLRVSDIPAIIFALLCFIEATQRARDARKKASDNAFLAKCEVKIARVFSSFCLSKIGLQVSSRRLSMADLSSDRSIRQESGDIKRIEKYRIWLRLFGIIVIWTALLPLRMPLRSCATCDCALLSSLIARLFHIYDQTCRKFTMYVVETKEHFIWNTALPFAIKKPRVFYARFRAVMTSIRWIKFGAPLFRLLDKLIKRLADSWRSHKQSNSVTEEKRMLQRKSIFSKNIQLLEREAKIKANIQAWKLQAYTKAVGKLQQMKRVGTAARIEETLEQEEKKTIETERDIERRIAHLKGSPYRASFADASTIYERLVSLRRDIFGKEKLNGFLSEHLLKPDSRFGYLWKSVVLACVILEVARLSASWHYSDNTNTDISFGKVLLIIFPRWNVAAAEIIGDVIERAISFVCILDIPIWFQMGEYNEYGLLIPKPVFARYIIPGTLAQILDHPTLFAEVSLMLWKIVHIADMVGYARFIRWIIILGPATQLMLQQTKSYLFCSVHTSTCSEDDGSTGILHARFKKTSLAETSLTYW